MPRGGGGAIGFSRFDMGSGDAFTDHVHEVHQLAWARRGVIMVRAGANRWVLPPSLALWIPAGTTHAASALEESVMQGIYLRPEESTVDWSVPTVVAVGSLLRALIMHLDDERLVGAARTRAEAVLFDVLTPVSLATIELPMPSDDRALAVAWSLLRTPGDDRSLEDWARTGGVSARTLSRLFVRQTRMSFSDWRTAARLQVALELLAGGRTVAQVARRVGYATPSAFVAAFRRRTGLTPGAYFGAARREAAS
jgi:AraC-like DNA-binding protein